MRVFDRREMTFIGVWDGPIMNIVFCSEMIRVIKRKLDYWNGTGFCWIRKLLLILKKTDMTILRCEKRENGHTTNK